MQKFPHRVRSWTFVIDRTHWKNPPLCHAGYNMDEFPHLKYVNSQQAEQINRSLKSLSTVLAHYRWETYRKVLELYFVRRNNGIKKLLKLEVFVLFCCYLFSFFKKKTFSSPYCSPTPKNFNTTTTTKITLNSNTTNTTTTTTTPNICRTVRYVGSVHPRTSNLRGLPDLLVEKLSYRFSSAQQIWSPYTL